MLITELLPILETMVPLAAAGYERDAVGLQVGPPAGTHVSRVLFAYEVTMGVIEEATARGANLIVVFHPLIFPSLTAVTDRTRTGRLLAELIRRGIALYVQHTAFDTQPELGTSHVLAQALGLREVRCLSPLIRQPSDTRAVGVFGMGAIGLLERPLSAEELLGHTRRVLGTPILRHNAVCRPVIERVAVVGGAGMDYYQAAVASGADALITADVRYHDLYRADHDELLLIDGGHAETEQFVTSAMALAAQRACEPHFGTDGLTAETFLTAQTAPNSVRYVA